VRPSFGANPAAVKPDRDISPQVRPRIAAMQGFARRQLYLSRTTVYESAATSPKAH